MAPEFLSAMANSLRILVKAWSLLIAIPEERLLRLTTACHAALNEILFLVFGEENRPSLRLVRAPKATARIGRER